MSRWQTARYRNFTGGENRKILPEFVQPNQAIVAQNCVLSVEGLLESRQGKTKVNTTSLGTGAVLGVWRWGTESGNKYLTVQHGTSLYNATWDGSSTISSFGTAVKTGLTAGKKLTGRVWKDNLILSNGTDNPFRFDGSTATDLAGTPPKFKIFEVYGGRLWVVPMTALSTVQSSGLEDYDTWNSLDTYKIRTGDGDTITGLFAFPNGLFITKLNTSWVLYGSSRFDVQITTSPVAELGAVSHTALFAPGVMFGKDNIYQFNLTGVKPISETHTSLIQGLSLTNKLNTFGVVDDLNRRILFHVDNANIFAVDGRYSGAITTWKNLNANCFEYIKASGDTGIVLIGDATNGYIYKMTGATDDGTAFETYITTPYLDFQATKDKVWRYLHPDIALLESGAWQLFGSYDVDYKRITGKNLYSGNYPNYLTWDVDKWDQAVWKGSSGVTDLTPYYFHGARGKYISFGMKSTVRFKLKGLVTKYREVGIL